MLQFILSTVVGGIVGFACSMAGTDVRTETQRKKETGDSYARSK